MRRFGDPSVFEIGYEFVPDPDKRDPTWGNISIRAGGRDLTYALTREGALSDSARVSLGAVGAWFAANWDTLAHEGGGPAARISASASWHVDMLAHLPADDAALGDLMAARGAWWNRHALGAALPGFRVPDVHFRRIGDDTEISWDDREWRSVPGGVEALTARGVVSADASVVLGTLYEWLEALAVELTARAPTVYPNLGADVTALRNSSRNRERALIAAGGAVRATIEKLVQEFGAKADAVFKQLLGDVPADERPFLAELPEPILLYRSAAPQLSPSDVQDLATLCANAIGKASSAFADFVAAERCPLDPPGSTNSGMALAEQLRERLSVPPDAALTGPSWDLEKAILRNRLSISIEHLSLSDASIEGAALLGPSHRPTIVVNIAGRFAHTSWGRRMTLAHELCHLLHDGGGKRRVGIVSNPWAPPHLERRANSFAINLLAPSAVLERVLPEPPDRWTPGSLRYAMREIGIGATALTWQLYNVGRINDAERRGLLDELTD